MQATNKKKLNLFSSLFQKTNEIQFERVRLNKHWPERNNKKKVLIIKMMPDGAGIDGGDGDIGKTLEKI